jgi:hypothetical protein
MKPGQIIYIIPEHKALDFVEAIPLHQGKGGVYKAKRGGTGGTSNSSTPGRSRPLQLIRRALDSAYRAKYGKREPRI